MKVTVVTVTTQKACWHYQQTKGIEIMEKQKLYDKQKEFFMKKIVAKRYRMGNGEVVDCFDFDFAIGYT